MFAARFPCVSIAARGAPAVPGREEQHRELGVVALDLGRHRVARREIADRRRAVEPEQLVAAPRRTSSTLAPTRSDWPASTFAGASGLSGTATAPAQSAAEVRGHEADVVVGGDRHPVAGGDPEPGERRPRPGPRATSSSANETDRSPSMRATASGRSAAGWRSNDTRFTAGFSQSGGLRGKTHIA